MKITANRLTFLRILLLPLPCLLLYGGPGAKLTALGLGSLLGLTDYFDGKLARRQGVTRLGAFLDPIADKIFIATLYFFLARLGFLPLWLVGGLLLREFLVSAIRPKVPGSLPVTWLAKVKTTFQMLVAALLVAVGTFPEWAFWSLLLASFVLLVGGWLSGVSGKRFLSLVLVAALLPTLSLLPAESVSFLLGLGVLSLTWVSAFSYLRQGFSSLVSKARFALAGEVLLPLLVFLFSASLEGWFVSLGPLVLLLFFLRAALLLIRPIPSPSKVYLCFSLLGLCVLGVPELIPAYVILVSFYLSVEVVALLRERIRELS